MMLKPMIRMILSGLLLWAIASPAFAQSRAELAAQNEQLRQRIERLESRMLTGDPAAERLMARVDTLETAVRTLRGELEQITYERDLKNDEIAALEGDIRELQTLATRVRIHLDAFDMVVAEQQQGRRPAPAVDESYVGGPATISAIPPAPTTRTQPFNLPPAGGSAGQSGLPPAAPNNSNDVMQLGAIGIQRLEEGDYAGAETALTQYLQFNPDADDTDVIHFWLGEALYVRGQFNGAAESYIASMRAAPQGEKAPDALVKLAASLREVGQVGEACNALASFNAQFPQASQLARDKAAREASRTGC